MREPALGHKRLHTDLLHPNDAQRHRVDLSKIYMFYPPVTSDPVTSRRWSSSIETPRLPPRKPLQENVRRSKFLEYSNSAPEVSGPRHKSIPRRASQRCAIDFKALPEAVSECVLQQLRILHIGRQSSSCTTCYARDLVTLQLTCKAWRIGARRKLYTHVDITGDDSLPHVKRYKIARGARLKLLRRTLREQPKIAEFVKTLNVPDPDIPLYLPDGEMNPAFDDYRNLVASVVMACPMLESLSQYSYFNHEYDRLTEALSRCRELRSHVWIITENDAVTARSQVQLSPGLLDRHQTDQFLQYNTWVNLETLMLCSPGSMGVIESHVFAQMFRSLPSLKKLCISSFDEDDFNSATLLTLPSNLTSLRIEECPGISDVALSRWVARPATDGLQTVSLIHQNIYSLLTLSKLLASLPSLVKMTIIQSDITPSLPAETMIIQPVLASSTLQRLHWDIVPEDQFLGAGHESPNAQLALSILHSGFPRLQSLRAPRDTSPPGALQSVCRPAFHASVLLPSDKFTLPIASEAMNSTDATLISRGNSLRAARLRAQSYIDEKEKEPKEFIRVIVTDHSRRSSIEDDSYSASSSDFSGASTEITDPNDLSSPLELRMIDFDLDSGISRRFDLNTTATITKVPIPPKSPLRPRRIEPLKVWEFIVPSFVGRVANSTLSETAKPPSFDLRPDVEGIETNGGVIGWGELLRVDEKARPETEDGKPWVRDGCTGAWNKGNAKSSEWWRHTERSRRRIGKIIELDHFF